MNLITLLRRNIGFSIAASGLQLLSTLATVRLAGPAAFADLTVDVFKLAVIAIFLELVPTPYANYRIQREADFGPHMATFSLASSLFCLAAWTAVAGAGLFSSATVWMAPYAVYLGAQRYLDIKLQAENRVQEYYQVLCIAAALRLALTIAGLLLIQGHDIEILWASLSLSSIASIAFWFWRKPGEAGLFLRRGHRGSVVELYAARSAYYPYYVNTALKRLRDSLLPVAASFVVADKGELARYLLAMRAVEFVMGQLRVVEALLANLGNRAAVHHNRSTMLLLLAVAAQAVTFVTCLFLAGQAGWSTSTIVTSAVASFFAYPYILEIGSRSDAYAEDAPMRVTISFAAFTVTLAVALAGLAHFGWLFAPALVATPVLAQTIASSTYWITRRLIRGRYTADQVAAGR